MTDHNESPARLAPQGEGEERLTEASDPALFRFLFLVPGKVNAEDEGHGYKGAYLAGSRARSRQIAEVVGEARRLIDQISVWAVSLRGGKEYTRHEIGEISMKAHELLEKIGGRDE